MATKSATATLSTDFYFTPVTGLEPVDAFVIDPDSGFLFAPSTTTWQSLAGSTWNNLGNWVNSTLPIRHTVDVFDLGTIQNFTLDIETTVSGTVKYYIYVSNTGEFTGEETETVIQEGDLVNNFRGRFVVVQVYTTANRLEEVTVSTNTETFEQHITDVDTSTLGGTVNERTLSLDNPVSGIVDINIVVQETTAYTQDVYVTDYPSSEVLIPVIKSKSLTPSFALYGLDNIARDGIIDIKITAMPQMKMQGGNLISNR